MKKSVSSLVFVFAVTAMLPAQELNLYSGPIPNNRKNVIDPERVDDRPTGGRFINNTTIPTLTTFVPEHPNGKAVIICPGGGYRGVAFDKEGILVAQALVADSITAIVLKYRTPNDSFNLDKSLAPLQDAQQAIRFVRRHALMDGIDPHKIGIMGFSAGGHLAATAANWYQTPADPTNRDTTTSLRPDFVILIYPVINLGPYAHMGSRINLLGENPTPEKVQEFSIETRVTPDSPPAFLVHAGDDKAVPVANSLVYYTACLENNVPVEMHLYPKGGHGFGMYNKTTEDDWMGRLRNWLKGL
ncbi:MAG: alpha/beta hydrolase [Lewinellaceae bacterium]|nr:alpha/beta hydrolase [Lewinellaceae bacterium]